MSKIRIGVMGCASIAQRLVIPAIISLSDDFELIAISSRTSEKAHQFANIFSTTPIIGYDNLLDRSDIDAVYMPLPTGLHSEWIEKALKAGKHVIAEKSLAMDYDSAQELVLLAKSKGLLLMENFMFRYHSQHQLVWQKLKNNDLGSLRLFRSQFGFPPLDNNNFRYDKNLGGGALLDTAAYTVRASQWFLGSEQEVVAAALYIDAEKNVDIYGNATLINNEGIVSQLSFGFDNYYQCNYEFWGSKGKLVAERAFTPKPNESTYILFEKKGDVAKLEVQPDNHFVNILKEFHQSILLNNHDTHLKDILSQSKILTDIRNKSINIKL